MLVSVALTGLSGNAMANQQNQQPVMVTAEIQQNIIALMDQIQQGAFARENAENQLKAHSQLVSNMLIAADNNQDSAEQSE